MMRKLEKPVELADVVMSELVPIRQYVVVMAILAVAASACSKSGADHESFTTRDSAGVWIAENASPEWPSGRGWALDSRPILSIGEADGDPTQQLYRVTAAVRVGLDTIVVVNAGTAEIRWYDGNGRFIRSVGRQGAGPGEFSRFGPGTLCVLPADKLLVGDPMQQRANIFTRTGAFVEVVHLTADAAFPSIQGCFADGTLLGWRSVGSPERVPGTIIQPRFVWSRVGGEGQRMAELVSLPASPQYLLDQGNGVATYHAIPFTIRPSAAAGSNHVYAAVGGPPLIEKRRLDGSLEMQIRWEPGSRVKTADVYDRYRTYTLDSQDTPERRSYWSKFFALNLEPPEVIPSVQSLKVDDLANIWAERYRLPWDSAAVWDVFEPDGRWLGGVPFGIGFQPLQIGSDFVLGLSRDALGVERVELHRLNRGAL